MVPILNPVSEWSYVCFSVDVFFDKAIVLSIIDAFYLPRVEFSWDEFTAHK